MWIDYMAASIPKYGAPDFPVPEGISHIMVNKETGKPLPPGSTDGFLESFVMGHEPGTTQATTDQNGQTSPAGSTTDDGDYYMNQ
jgi:membrane carboxypeptidase/penicillin-binding protein